MEGEIPAKTALASGSNTLKEFLVKNTRENDLVMFTDLIGDKGYEDHTQVPLTVILPAFITSELKTADGVYIMVPNSSLWNTNIINYSRNLTRRIEVEIGISYEDDLIGAMNVLMNVMRADSRVLNDPAPQTIITELADSSVNIKMRCWSSADDSWLAPFDLRRNAKLEIEKAGYTIPFPQREVRIIDSFPISTQEK